MRMPIFLLCFCWGSDVLAQPKSSVVNPSASFSQKLAYAISWAQYWDNARIGRPMFHRDRVIAFAENQDGLSIRVYAPKLEVEFLRLEDNSLGPILEITGFLDRQNSSEECARRGVAMRSDWSNSSCASDGLSVISTIPAGPQLPVQKDTQMQIPARRLCDQRGDSKSLMPPKIQLVKLSNNLLGYPNWLARAKAFKKDHDDVFVQRSREILSSYYRVKARNILLPASSWDDDPRFYVYAEGDNFTAIVVFTRNSSGQPDFPKAYFHSENPDFVTRTYSLIRRAYPRQYHL